MITKYFKCKLLTDVVLNSSLTTEGNMQSLDYIPGSNFLGIVAKKYRDFGNSAYAVFHSGKVSFGDALISRNETVSYKMPYSLFLDKLENNLIDDTVWVHHGINNFEEIIDENKNKRQLKQHRTGYLNKVNKYIPKVEKEFALKSAYNREERRSDDGKMFGFESIKKGQEFIFSVVFEDEKYINKVSEALIGEKHIGKSKTAQYGLVKISKIENEPERFKTIETKNNKLVVYAESNLCFLNVLGQATFQPKPSDFGIFGIDEKDLNNEDRMKYGIKWEDSQIRTYTYSPWNAKRNTPDTQRDIVLKGSVIVIELNEKVDIDKLPNKVGEYNAEGLGRVIYNPEFLEFGENGTWIIKLSEHKKDDNKQDKVPINSDLGKFLQNKANVENLELEIGNKILEVFKEDEKNGKVLLSDKITKSQWGNIRTLATRAKDIDELNFKLFDKDKGYLTHGVADEKIWGKQNGKRRDALKKVIEENKKLGTKFVAKFAAEIAKKN